MDLSLYHPEISAVAGSAGRDHRAPQLLISFWLYAEPPPAANSRHFHSASTPSSPRFRMVQGSNIFSSCVNRS